MMRLKDLLQEIEYEVFDQKILDSEVEHVTSDSRHVRPGSVFVCIKGLKSDGHQFAQQAVKAGAIAVITKEDFLSERKILVREDERAVYGKLCSAFYDYPSKKLKLIGVTGTNGKTTVTHLIKQILEKCGHKTGLIGTIQNEIGQMKIPARYTTPDPSELHSLFQRMVLAGCEYAVMEVSSHALDQKRLEGCEFEVGTFTNLTQDHLDYHGTMEEYFNAKAKLFTMARNAVLNYDDPMVRGMIKQLDIPIITFSIESNEADYTAKNIRQKPSGIDFELLGMNRIARVNFCMPGAFSVSNALAAASSCILSGISFDDAVLGLNSCTGVKGRTQMIETGKDFSILCDYAHTPDGLEKLLTSMKEFGAKRVVTLFGCAGDRDRTKRPKMAHIVSSLSDFTVISSDNPRTEDPMQIIDDMLPGLVKEKPYKVIPDRYEAIMWVVKNAMQGDLIVLAGKGHEDYQVIKGCTIYFDESEIVKEALKIFWGD